MRSFCSWAAQYGASGFFGLLQLWILALSSNLLVHALSFPITLLVMYTTAFTVDDLEPDRILKTGHLVCAAVLFGGLGFWFWGKLADYLFRRFFAITEYTHAWNRSKLAWSWPCATRFQNWAYYSACGASHAIFSALFLAIFWLPFGLVWLLAYVARSIGHNPFWIGGLAFIAMLVGLALCGRFYHWALPYFLIAKVEVRQGWTGDGIDSDG